ncbi:hypothetical protein FGLOB1_5486 [Fusarium globosum]|uniref:Uncharacterized protein n=1 Tax=Fusarium globosum TaxID=78864 RepID=A0A8H5YD77_9HYPO|nr:hypothetical protein FGLOB1_5486 [Fusarium globosum]
MPLFGCAVAHQFPDASSQPGCDSPQQKYRYVSASHVARAFGHRFLTRPASPDDSVNRTFDSLTFPLQHAHDPSWSHSTTLIDFPITYVAAFTAFHNATVCSSQVIFLIASEVLKATGT